MTINTKTVSGRRDLRFFSLEEVLADAEAMVDKNAATVGNWTLGQILQHLAAAMHLSIDGADRLAPWFLRLVGPFILRSILKKGMSPGFSLPAPLARKIVPDEDPGAEAGLEALRLATARLQAEEQRKPHFFFGPLTLEQWEKLHLRHAELHLSFAVARDIATQAPYITHFSGVRRQ